MTAGLQASAQEQLRRLVEQIERLQTEQKELSADVADKFKEAKGLGFDVKILRQIIRLRKKSESERQEEETLLAVYSHALGMDGTPMGDWLNQESQSAQAELVG